MNQEIQIREQIIEAGKRLYDRFFIAANDGNISARLNSREILITPTGINKGDILPQEILKVDEEGNILSGSKKPTSEIKMHLAVYRKRADLGAILHAHPPAATGFAACRIRLDQEVILPEVVFGLGRIGFAEYGTPTTLEVPRAVEREIEDCEALLLANHGALAVGGSVMQAYYRMETLEMYCRVRLVTHLLGGAKTLAEGEVDELIRIREQRGWGRSPEGAGELPVDQKLIDVIAGVVLKVLESREEP